MKAAAALGRQLWELVFQVALLGVVLCAFVQVFSFGEATLDLSQPGKSVLYTRSGDSILGSVREGAKLSFLLVGGGLLASITISAVLGWAFAVRPRLSAARLFLVLLSAFPVFALSYWLMHVTGLPYLLQGILVLAAGDLVLASMTSEVYLQMTREIGRAYVLAAEARGERPWRHYWRRFLVIALESVRPRLPFLLGSSVVVERVYAMDGLGELAVSAAERGEVPVLIWLALLSLALVRVYGILVELIRHRLTPELRKADLKQEGRLKLFFRDTLDGIVAFLTGRKYPARQAKVEHLSGKDRGPDEEDSHKGVPPRARGLLRLRLGNYVARSRGNQLKALAALLCALCAAVFIVACLIGPGADLSEGLEHQFAPPTRSHWLGLDEDGKDLFAQLLLAGRFLVPPAAAALLLVVAVAAPLGLLSGYFGGHTVRLADRFMDVLDSVPKLVLVLLAVVVFEAREGYLWKIIPFIGLTFAPAVFYQVRDSARLMREQLFVERARALGCSEARIVFLHVLWNNSRHRLLIALAYILGGIILMDASIGYLELSQPDFPTWGALAVKGVKSAKEFGGLVIDGAKFNGWAVWGPMGVLVLMMSALSTVGDGMRVLLGDE